MYPPPHDGYPKYSAPPQIMVPPPPPPPPPPPHFQPMPTGIQFVAPMHIQSQAPIRWSTGLFDCFEDCTNCCVTIWCPCITFGQIAEIVDRGSSSCATSGALYTLILWISGLSCLYSCFYRSKLRSQYVLEESPCPDCLVHCCCELCALCQEYRELKIRGFDMSIGWQANVERQSRGVTLLPPMQPGMMR